MADPAVAGVEARRVPPVQPLHALGERRLAALDDQVEMVAHQAVDVQLPGEALRDSQQELHEVAAIVVVHEDQSPVDSARGEVVHAVREGRALRSRHR
jgi:hypothetical protein